MKRIFIIIAVIFVIVGVGILLYFTLGPSAPHLTVSNNSFPNSGTTNPASSGSTNQASNSGAGTVVAPNLVEITKSPVAAGVAVLDILPATTTVSLASSTATTTTQSSADIEVRYIDRQSGNIYAYRAQARSLSRISDKTLPGIQLASWLPDGSMALVRFITDTTNSESINTYALPANGTDGYFLAQDLDDAKILGQNAIFTLAAGTNGSIGTVAHLDGSNAATIFSSPLSTISVYPAGNSFIAVTKAASELDGYAFSINPSTGVFTPVLGPLRGLTALPSPSGQYLLYSYADGSSYKMGVLNLANGQATLLPVATITEKCVWSDDNATLYCGIPTAFGGNLPDDWYQGATSFTDRIWRIDLSNRLATLVVDPFLTGGATIDVVNPTLDAANQLLVFRNKKDSSLWAYHL